MTASKPPSEIALRSRWQPRRSRRLAAEDSSKDRVRTGVGVALVIELREIAVKAHVPVADEARGALRDIGQRVVDAAGVAARLQLRGDGFRTGVVAAAGTAAAVSLVYGLKKWAEDETSQEIKFTTGGKNGVCISKTDDGKYIVDTKYDWASDPAFADVAEDDGIIIDISGGDDGTACCCDECEEEAPAEEAGETEEE